MSNELGKEGSWVTARVVTEEDKLMPPLKGWQYFDGNKMQSDPTLECTTEVSSACSEVVVELHGAVKMKHPGLDGSYLPVKEKHNRGRWVGSYQHLHFTIVIDATIVYLCDKYLLCNGTVCV